MQRGGRGLHQNHGAGLPVVHSSVFWLFFLHAVGRGEREGALFLLRQIKKRERNREGKEKDVEKE
jgi:hypothetical protein